MLAAVCLPVALVVCEEKSSDANRGKVEQLEKSFEKAVLVGAVCLLKNDYIFPLELNTARVL